MNTNFLDLSRNLYAMSINYKAIYCIENNLIA